MKFLKKNDGLTLVELMVSIAIGTMIFAAATTVLLLGIRINHHTTDSVMQQYTARTVITVLEDLAEEGTIDRIDRMNDGSWIVRNEDQEVLLSYDGVGQTIYIGSYPNEEANDVGGTPILENIIASYVILENEILTISLEDPEQTYTSSMYFRIRKDNRDNNFQPNDYNKEEKLEGIEEQRKTFIKILTSQVGGHGGIIKYPSPLCDTDTFCSQRCHTYNFFSQWFIGGYDNNPGWNAETPWCACFVSWGLCHLERLEPQGDQSRWYANVDTFMGYFTAKPEEATDCWKPAGCMPAPGDLIFFDMVDGTKNNPSHMGVVLSISDDGNTVTTIEGNSADMVAVREYDIEDPRIIGYGDPWAAQTD